MAEKSAAEKKAVTKKEPQRTEVVEHGNIWFIYRPKVRAEDEPEQNVGRHRRCRAVPHGAPAGWGVPASA